MDSPATHVRPATPADVDRIAAFIRALAEYERLTAECVFDPADLRDHLFGPRPCAEVLIAEVDSTPVGFALFFPTYSTFLGRPGLWLEDLFVLPEARRHGAGGALLRRLTEIATERGCGRLEWSVLDWNQPAIDFYRSLGARLLDDWTTCRLVLTGPGGG
jgi:GNAT superfamily N-acetyltransferase